MYIRRCIFLAEHNRSFHGYSSKISDPDTGQGCITAYILAP